jgi:hypothetical protein
MGTLKTQKHLEGLLADNSNKAISALDVRTIVTSNYQPQMIWAGFFTDAGNVPSNVHRCRTMYYNPSFFSEAAITASSSTACWKVTNAGTGVPDGTYTNQTLTPPATYGGFGGSGIPWSSVGGEAFGAVFNFTVTGGSGQISNVELVSAGSGWIGQTTDTDVPVINRPGMVGSFNISGASAQPTIEFLGPIQITAEDNDILNLSMSTNATAQGSAQKNHFGMNTLALVSAATTADEHQSAYLNAPNELYVETNNVNTNVCLWRMPQFA